MSFVVHRVGADRFVVDSSVALTWCFEDERTPATIKLLEQLAETGAAAPSLWPLEVLNGLAMAERRKRITATQRHHLTGFLHELPVTLDHETAAQAWTTMTRLAQLYGLTLYDAAYLELAQRLSLPLATLDKELRQAANGLSLPLPGLASSAEY